MNVGSILSRILKNTGDDVVGTIAKNYDPANIASLAKTSADDIAASQGNMIATHQLTSNKLRQAADLGGFVQPSMAVVDPSKATNFLPGGDFGEIVMVANRDAINPANKASKTILGDRDIYSPRFPDTTHDLIMPAMDDLATRSGKSKQFAISNIDVNTDDPSYNSFFQDLYRKENPAAADINTFELRDMPEFKQYANDLLGSVRGDKKLTYRTNSGASKNIDYTAENANKLMSKASTIGGESWHESPHSKLYHQNTTKLKSLDDIYKSRYRFIDNQTGDKTKDAMGDHMSEIAAKIDALKLPELATDNPYEQYDRVLNYMVDAASGHKDLYPSLDKMPQDVLDGIAELGKVYKDVPVSYFEAKPRRVVGGNEFHGAYIPDNSSPEVIEQLKKLGVENIRKYLDAGDLDLQLSALAKEGKRGVNPYVLGTAGAIPTAGILGNLLSGNQQQEQERLI
jgi:hypothetical protein